MISDGVDSSEEFEAVITTFDDSDDTETTDSESGESSGSQRGLLSTIEITEAGTERSRRLLLLGLGVVLAYLLTRGES